MVMMVYMTVVERNVVAFLGVVSSDIHLETISRAVRNLLKIAQNSIEVVAKIKESTKKTEEELDGRNKECHERKKTKRRPVGR
jgi:uncharacterized spore protein YtfJ